MSDQNSQALVWSIMFGGGDTTPDPDDWQKAGQLLEEITNDKN